MSVLNYIHDHALLNMYLEEAQIYTCFETPDLKFQLVSFSKGEYLSTPDKALTSFLFVLKGELHIFGIREDGTVFSINNEGRGSVLGNMELCKQMSSIYFTEALETTYCIALAIEENRSALEKDTVFLRFLLTHMANRLSFFSQLDLSSQLLEEKLLLYLKDMEADHEIHKINTVVAKLHCSRRQLQRVIRNLCEEGKLEKLKKGDISLS